MSHHDYLSAIFDSLNQAYVEIGELIELIEAHQEIPPHDDLDEQVRRARKERLQSVRRNRLVDLRKLIVGPRLMALAREAGSENPSALGDPFHEALVELGSNDPKVLRRWLARVYEATSKVGRLRAHFSPSPTAGFAPASEPKPTAANNLPQPPERQGSPDEYQDLRRVIGELELVGNEKRAVELLCSKGGPIQLADLATELEWPFSDPGANWNSLQTRLNKKFKRYGWRFSRRNNHARAIRSKAKS